MNPTTENASQSEFNTAVATFLDNLINNVKETQTEHPWSAIDKIAVASNYVSSSIKEQQQLKVLLNSGMVVRSGLGKKGLSFQSLKEIEQTHNMQFFYCPKFNTFTFQSLKIIIEWLFHGGIDCTYFTIKTVAFNFYHLDINQTDFLSALSHAPQNFCNIRTKDGQLVIIPRMIRKQSTAYGQMSELCPVDGLDINMFYPKDEKDLHSRNSINTSASDNMVHSEVSGDLGQNLCWYIIKNDRAELAPWCPLSLWMITPNQNPRKGWLDYVQSMTEKYGKDIDFSIASFSENHVPVMSSPAPITAMTPDMRQNSISSEKPLNNTKRSTAGSQMTQNSIMSRLMANPGANQADLPQVDTPTSEPAVPEPREQNNQPATPEENYKGTYPDSFIRIPNMDPQSPNGLRNSHGINPDTSMSTMTPTSSPLVDRSPVPYTSDLSSPWEFPLSPKSPNGNFDLRTSIAYDHSFLKKDRTTGKGMRPSDFSISNMPNLLNLSRDTDPTQELNKNISTLQQDMFSPAWKSPINLMDKTTTMISLKNPLLEPLREPWGTKQIFVICFGDDLLRGQALLLSQLNNLYKLRCRGTGRAEKDLDYRSAGYGKLYDMLNAIPGIRASGKRNTMQVAMYDQQLFLKYRAQVEVQAQELGPEKTGDLQFCKPEDLPPWLLEQIHRLFVNRTLKLRDVVEEYGKMFKGQQLTCLRDYGHRDLKGLLAAVPFLEKTGVHRDAAYTLKQGVAGSVQNQVPKVPVPDTPNFEGTDDWRTLNSSWGHPNAPHPRIRTDNLNEPNRMNFLNESAGSGFGNHHRQWNDNINEPPASYHPPSRPARDFIVPSYTTNNNQGMSPLTYGGGAINENARYEEWNHLYDNWNYWDNNNTDSIQNDPIQPSGVHQQMQRNLRIVHLNPKDKKSLFRTSPPAVSSAERALDRQGKFEEDRMYAQINMHTDVPAIVVLLSSGVIVQTNTLMQQLTGKTAQQLQKLPVYDILDVDSGEWFQQVSELTVLGGHKTFQRGECKLITGEEVTVEGYRHGVTAYFSLTFDCRIPSPSGNSNGQHMTASMNASFASNAALAANAANAGSPSTRRKW